MSSSWQNKTKLKYQHIHWTWYCVHSYLFIFILYLSISLLTLSNINTKKKKKNVEMLGLKTKLQSENKLKVYYDGTKRKNSKNICTTKWKRIMCCRRHAVVDIIGSQLSIGYMTKRNILLTCLRFSLHISTLIPLIIFQMISIAFFTFYPLIYFWSQRCTQIPRILLDSTDVFYKRFFQFFFFQKLIWDMSSIQNKSFDKKLCAMN